MKKYRIVKVTTFNWERYYIQKRKLGFLWWCYVEDLEFNNLEAARKAIQMLLYKTKKAVIDEV